MHPMLTIAKRAAEEASKVLQMGFYNLDQIQVQEKGRADLVSIIDQQAERVIREVLTDKYPHHDFLGEEGGGSDSDRQSEYLWIIDPLDGTTNFLHGIPHFAISIALMKQDKLETAIVYNPITKEMFTASRGQGAQLNERKIRVNPQREGSRAIIATGFPTRNPAKLQEQYPLVTSVLQEFGDIRRFGAAALDLAAVACGRMEGYFEHGIHPWDIAGGILIAQEAGALVTNYAGKSISVFDDNIICANPYLHKALLNRVQNANKID